MSKLRRNIEDIVIDDQGNWLKKARYRRANRSWLRKSHYIAVRILSVMDEKGIQKNELAKSIDVSSQQVSKILKGKQNLTLEMISRLETELGVSLVNIPEGNIQVDE